jgi:thiamine-monophosphate kinase
MAGEFDLITRYFKPLAGPEGLSLSDDAACVPMRDRYDLIISKDMLVSDVHFFRNDPADSIAQKALAVNLSDLAAKGATPRYYMLGLSLPSGVSEKWLSDFSTGLKNTQEKIETPAGFYLIGGDTTKSPNDTITISVTIFGEVPSGQMTRRSGAVVGDDVYVTGELGLAAFGLCALKDELALADQKLVEAYLRPCAQTKVGIKLIGTASASADISDGLLADLGHICTASGVGARIETDKIPTVQSIRKICERQPDYRKLIWSGGDDYELVFTARPSKRPVISNLARDFNTLITRVGYITDEKAVRLVDADGVIIADPGKGYEHF